MNEKTIETKAEALRADGYVLKESDGTLWRCLSYGGPLGGTYVTLLCKVGTVGTADEIRERVTDARLVAEYRHAPTLILQICKQSFHQASRNMKPQELKLCPFCGGRPVRVRKKIRGATPNRDEDGYAHYVRCGSCAAKSGWSKGRGSAEMQWNART